MHITHLVLKGTSILFLCLFCIQNVSSACAETEYQELKKENSIIEKYTEYMRYEPEELKGPVLPEYKSELIVNWDEMKNKNAEYYAWIHIPDSKISYPVLKPADNKFYLSHDFNKSVSAAGSIFLDAYTPDESKTVNKIFYGHNMRNKSMFGSLKYWLDETYFQEHPIIELHYKDHIEAYEIFSIREVNSDINTLNYAINGFSPADYIAEAEKTAIHFRKPERDGTLLSLSTCMGIDSKRLMINAVRIR